MKAKYINPFLTAALNLFRDHLEVKCTDLAPYLNKDPAQLAEISAIIGLAGETTGAVVLSFDRAPALAIAGKFAGRTFSALTNEAIDCIGELVNIVAGNAKRDLLDFKILISLPGVFIGQEARIKWPEGVPVITIPFTSELGKFSVNISLKE